MQNRFAGLMRDKTTISVELVNKGRIFGRIKSMDLLTDYPFIEVGNDDGGPDFLVMVEHIVSVRISARV